MSELFTGLPQTVSEDGISSVDITQLLNMGDEALKSVFYNPFCDGDPNRLSVSAMLKTSWVMSKAFSDGSIAQIADWSNISDEDEKSMEDLFKGQNVHMVMKIVGFLTKWVCYRLGMIICTFVLMIEYSITIIEFFLVGAISMLIIPLFFIDATKQFAANLVKMIFSYFVKIFVTILLVYFVMGMYLRLANDTLAAHLDDTIVCLYYLYILFLGLILAKSGGKITSAVISGNPSLGIGDVVHEMRGMSHAMHTAERAFEKTVKDVQGTMEKGKKAGHDVAVNNEAAGAIRSRGAEIENSTRDKLTALQGSAKGKVDALQAKLDGGGTLSDAERDELAVNQGLLAMDKEDINAAALGARNDFESNAFRQANSDYWYNKLTGLERVRGLGETYRVGQKFYDDDGNESTTTIGHLHKTGTPPVNNAVNNAVDKAKKNARKLDQDIDLYGM